MKQAIELSGHKAQITLISPHLADGIRSKEDMISVWLDLLDPVNGTMGFGFDIPVHQYSKEEFLKLVVREGERKLAQIKADYAQQRALRELESTRKKVLTEIVEGILKELE